MGRSLYDLLEVSENASQDVIHAAYSRLSDKLKSQIATDNTSNAEIQLRAIADAYRTLSKPESRQRYDHSLAMKNVEYEEDQPFWTRTKLIIAALILLVAGVAYSQHVRQVEREKTERARIAAEQAEKELAAKIQEEADRLESERARQEQLEAAQQKAQIERDRRYAEQVSARVNQQQVYEQQRLDREQRAEQQRMEYERRRKEQEALRQAEAEKRKLRELEYQNRSNRPSVVVVPR